MEPRRFGPFELIEKLGRGAGGSVFAARVGGDAGFSLEVAIKVVDPRRTRDNPDMLEALRNEARVLSRLDHPFIVSVLGLRRVEDPSLGCSVALVMDYVRGVDLLRLMRAASAGDEPFSVSEVLFLLAMMSEALDHAHRLCDDVGRPLGLVHRDIKPANLMITRDGRARLLDFGIAFTTRRAGPDTGIGFTKGTVLHMSPEQIRGGRLDGRSDLYNLGLLAFELLSGQRYFPLVDGEDVPIHKVLAACYEVRYADRSAILRDALERTHRLEDGDVDVLDQLIGSLLAFDVQERPRSAGRLLEQIEELYRRWRPEVARRRLAERVRLYRDMTRPYPAPGTGA